MTSTQTAKIDLLPCPFCGSKAFVGGFMNEQTLNAVAFVACKQLPGCSAKISVCLGKEPTRQEAESQAIAAWNTRHEVTKAHEAEQPQDIPHNAEWLAHVEEMAKRDDWYAELVGSDIRMLCGLVRRYQASLKRESGVSPEARKTLTKPLNCLIGYCDSVDALPPQLNSWGDQLKALAGDLSDAWQRVTAHTEDKASRKLKS